MPDDDDSAKQGATTKGRNLVVLCDGTGKEIEENMSNVLRLFRIAQRDNPEEQTVFYDPGLGTLEDLDAWAQLRTKMQQYLGLATGWGLDANVLQAYRFLMERYRPGDRIFLFGYSRGAYTVRVLAGFLYVIGLLPPEQANLVGYALVAYKKAGNVRDKNLANDTTLAAAFRFGTAVQARRVGIHFMGCWDTVSSVFVPGGLERAFLPNSQTLPYTASNPGVRHFRHACAVDERRRYFKVNHWKPPEHFKISPYSSVVEEHVTKQMWFVGSHGDVGGGHPEKESELAKVALNWMINEAVAEGLFVHESRRKWFVLGKPASRGANKNTNVGPSATGKIHNSMTAFYRIFDLVPSGPREIPITHLLHPSVLERTAKDKSYQPPNVTTYQQKRKADYQDIESGDLPLRRRLRKRRH